MHRSRMRHFAAGNHRITHRLAMLNGCVRVTTRLRRLYFAQASEPAGRYGIDFEQVLAHLWRARKLLARLPMRHVTHMDDLVLALACIDGQPQAWVDLGQEHEAALVRTCRRRMDDAESIVFVRRLLADLRRGSRIAAVRGIPSLHCYVGTQPLRAWLIERAQGRLGQALPVARESGRQHVVSLAAADDF